MLTFTEGETYSDIYNQRGKKYATWAFSTNHKVLSKEVLVSNMTPPHRPFTLGNSKYILWTGVKKKVQATGLPF